MRSNLPDRLGMDVIVTDHHQVPPTPPDAVAVLNPHQSECGYPAKELAGVGVAFKLVMALRGRLRQEARWASKTPNLRRHLDLVALGTIADIAPPARGKSYSGQAWLAGIDPQPETWCANVETRHPHCGAKYRTAAGGLYAGPPS